MIYTYPMPFADRPWNYRSTGWKRPPKGKKAKKPHKKYNLRKHCDDSLKRQRSDSKFKSRPHDNVGVFYPYDLAKYIVRYYGIRSFEEYRRWRQYIMDPAIPSEPPRRYAADWVDWKTFLGENASTKTQIGGKTAIDRSIYLPQAEAAKWVHERIGPWLTPGQRERKLWIKFVNEHKLPEFIPRSPDLMYAPNWKGFSFWFGRSTSGQMQVKQELLPLLAITTVPDTSDNVIDVIYETQGLKVLKEVLVVNNKTAHAVFNLTREDAPIVKQLIDDLTSINDDGERLVNNKHELIFELDAILERTNLSMVNDL